MRWAERAERPWIEFCEDLVRSLEEVNTAEDWICEQGAWVRKVVSLAPVQRFSEEIQYPRSWLFDLACCRNHAGLYVLPHIHVNQPLDEGLFLTPGAAFFTWLVELHRKLSENYDHLERRIRPANRLETRGTLANLWTGM